MSIRSFATRILFGFNDWRRDRPLRLPDGVIVRRDIPYAEAGTEHLLDLMTPSNAVGKLPVIVSIHGGGYVYGSKEVYRYYAANLAENGFAVVNFNYRLAPQSRFPAQLEDINRAMSWLASQGEAYGLDRNNVFVVGDSAGAQLASHYLAIWSDPDFETLFSFRTPTDLSIRAAALNCGRYRIVPGEPLFRDYLEKGISPEDSRLDVVSHITESFPPTFVMTSQYDFLREEARPMYELLQSRKVDAVYRLYGQRGQRYMSHVFHCNLNLEEARQCNREECEFFRKRLRAIE
jgi:acetyl esterase/lipase